MHCKVMKLSFQKGRGSKCKEDTKTDTVPPTSSPFKASKLTGSQSHNEKILRVLGFGFGWATRCVWASLRLLQTVWASGIQPVGCKIYKGTLRYHIFIYSFSLGQKNALRASSLPVLPCYSCGISVKEWMSEKMESNRRTALTKPFPNQSSCSYTLKSLTSQCQRQKKSLKRENHNPRVLPRSEYISVVFLQLKWHCQSSDSSEQPLEESVSVPHGVCGQSPESTAWVGAQLRCRYQVPPEHPLLHVWPHSEPAWGTALTSK